MFLNVVGTTEINEIITTGGYIGVLAFFLAYFMREQKEQRQKIDAIIQKNEADINALRKSYESEMNALRRAYEDKLEMAYKRIEELNSRSYLTLDGVKDSNEKLTTAVNSLTAKLNNRG